MLSRSQAKIFFIGSTVLASAAFVALTIHSFTRIPEMSNQEAMSPLVIEGKHLWDKKNCMGCHTILGEGGYYAPELTKVYERRGPAFIRAVIEDPQGMYPGQRKMYEYDLTDHEIEAFIAFFEWIGGMDLNGFPPKPDLFNVATVGGAGDVAERDNRPQIYNQMCVACHAMGGQGGSVGPALDDIGDRMTQRDIEVWLADPNAIRPGTTMPKLPLTDAVRSELAAYLATLRNGPGPAGDPPPGSPEAETKGPDVPPLEEGEADKEDAPAEQDEAGEGGADAPAQPAGDGGDAEQPTNPTGTEETQ